MYRLYINDTNDQLVSWLNGRLQTLVRDYSKEYVLPSYGIIWHRIKASGGFAQYVRHRETNKLYLVRILPLEEITLPPPTATP